MHDLSKKLNIKINTGHLAPGIPDLVDEIVQDFTLDPDATFLDFYKHVSALLKVMVGKELDLKASSLVFALKDNGSNLTE